MEELREFRSATETDYDALALLPQSDKAIPLMLDQKDTLSLQHALNFLGLKSEEHLGILPGKKPTEFVLVDRTHQDMTEEERRRLRQNTLVRQYLDQTMLEFVESAMHEGASVRHFGRAMVVRDKCMSTELLMHLRYQLGDSYIPPEDRFGKAF